MWSASQPWSSAPTGIPLKNASAYRLITRPSIAVSTVDWMIVFVDAIWTIQPRRSISAAMHLLPTTMVGSYPRPQWFTQQLAGRDVLEAFKIASHAEAFHDATRTVIKDQEGAGLDILTDGQMWFDDYNMGIGSFLWYWLERTKGFSSEKLPHPAKAKAKGRDIWALDEAGGVAVEGPIERGPVRMGLIYQW